MPKLNLWLGYAQNDLKAARLLFASESINVSTVLYFTQQCAEKALKAYLLAQNYPIARTHDRIKLVEVCMQFDSEFEIIVSQATALNPFAVKTRYPEDFLSMLHTIVAEQAICYAREILQFSEMKIASLASSYKSSKKHIRKQV